MLKESYLRVYDTEIEECFQIKGESCAAVIDVRICGVDVSAAMLKEYFYIDAVECSNSGELYEEMSKLLRGEPSEWGFTSIRLEPGGIIIELRGVGFEQRARDLYDALTACGIDPRDPEVCGAQVCKAADCDDEWALVYNDRALRLKVTVREPDGTESYYMIAAYDHVGLSEYRASTASERDAVGFDPFVCSRLQREYDLRWLENWGFECGNEEKRFMVAEITECH